MELELMVMTGPEMLRIQQYLDMEIEGLNGPHKKSKNTVLQKYQEPA